MVQGPAVTFTPVKNTNKFNGVTAGDATRIQQHVVGLNLLGAPYPRIAADVNKNNVISVQDATLITQSILGNPAANNAWNTSWRFVDAAYTFPTPNAPWNFPEYISLTNASTDQNGLDFLGVKLGDVTTPAANPALKPEAVVLHTVDQRLSAGQILSIPVQVRGYADIAAFQFVIRFDPNLLHFEQLELPDGGILSSSNFGTFRTEFGELRCAVAAANASSVDNGSLFFALRFTALQSGVLLSQTLDLDESVFPAEAYTVNIEPRPIQLAIDESTALSSMEMASKA
jgi:hypothetical protein